MNPGRGSVWAERGMMNAWTAELKGDYEDELQSVNTFTVQNKLRQGSRREKVGF